MIKRFFKNIYLIIKANSNPRSIKHKEINIKQKEFYTSSSLPLDYVPFLANYQDPITFQSYKYSSLSLLALTNQALHQV